MGCAPACRARQPHPEHLVHTPGQSGTNNLIRPAGVNLDDLGCVACRSSSRSPCPPPPGARRANQIPGTPVTGSTVAPVRSEVLGAVGFARRPAATMSSAGPRAGRVTRRAGSCTLPSQWEALATHMTSDEMRGGLGRRQMAGGAQDRMMAKLQRPAPHPGASMSRGGRRAGEATDPPLRPNVCTGGGQALTRRGGKPAGVQARPSALGPRPSAGGLRPRLQLLVCAPSTAGGFAQSNPPPRAR